MSVTLAAKPETLARKSEGDIPVLEADQTLARLADEFTLNPHEAVAVITRHGKPALAVLSMEYFESLLETLEVMSDEEMMAALRDYQKKVKSGEPIVTYSLEEVKRNLGL